MQLSVLSKEYVRVRVAAREAGVVVDPTTDTVQLAFMTTGAPASGDWKTGSWETDSSSGTAAYFARCLVAGASAPSTAGAAITLAVGTYSVWVRITDNPEAPIRRVGGLEVA